MPWDILLKTSVQVPSALFWRKRGMSSAIMQIQTHKCKAGSPQDTHTRRVLSQAEDSFRSQRPYLWYGQTDTQVVWFTPNPATSTLCQLWVARGQSSGKKRSEVPEFALYHSFRRLLSPATCLSSQMFVQSHPKVDNALGTKAGTIRWVGVISLHCCSHWT